MKDTSLLASLDQSDSLATSTGEDRARAEKTENQCAGKFKVPQNFHLSNSNTVLFELVHVDCFLHYFLLFEA